MDDQPLEAEYGSAMPLFISKTNMIDRDGNVIEERRCEKCGNAMGLAIGSRSSTWICWNCG